ncbi:MAG TPA: phage holin family protein [Propionibacteriaceae bacterium]|nr:phage holin family protein [Propionibacteriaceae bacterium]
MSQTQDLKSQVSTLLDAVKALALGWKDKAIAQAKPKAKSAGILGGSFGAAGMLAVKALSLLILAAAAGFGALYASVMNPWAAAALGLVTVAVILLVLAGILALVGRAQIPELTKKVDIGEDVKQGAETVKTGIEKGKAEVEAEIEGVHPAELDLR